MKITWKFIQKYKNQILFVLIAILLILTIVFIITSNPIASILTSLITAITFFDALMRKRKQKSETEFFENNISIEFLSIKHTIEAAYLESERYYNNGYILTSKETKSDSDFNNSYLITRLINQGNEINNFLFEGLIYEYNDNVPIKIEKFISLSREKNHSTFNYIFKHDQTIIIIIAVSKNDAEFKSISIHTNGYSSSGRRIKINKAIKKL